MMTGQYNFNNDREILSIFPYVYHFYLGALPVLHEGNQEHYYGTVRYGTVD